MLSISKTHSGSFTPGQQNATYQVTVTNAANAGTTSGVVTVTESVPSGLLLVSMTGTGWTCEVASRSAPIRIALRGRSELFADHGDGERNGQRDFAPSECGERYLAADRSSANTTDSTTITQPRGAEHREDAQRQLHARSAERHAITVTVTNAANAADHQRDGDGDRDVSHPV